MWIFLKLAWRNVLRHKRRTLLAGSAIGLGLAALIFVDALMLGMEENMVHSATASFMGEGQIHHAEFRETQEVDKTIQNLDGVIAKLQQDPLVERFTPRTMAFGMITSAANVNAISLIGIDPSTEHGLSQIDEAIVEGNYFDGDNPRDVVIGSKLAAILEVGLGGRLVITVAQAETGDLSQEMFRVAGLYHFNVREMDSGMAFIRLEKSQQMLGLDHQVHEIALKFTDMASSRDEALPFWDTYSQDGNEALGWTRILPQLKAAFELSQFSVYLTGVILFGVVVFGIINTLFMSLYERMFEFGVLRAVGTRPFRMAQLILFEAGVLALLSIGLGIGLGLLVTYITTKTGIDYRGIEFAGVTMREMLIPVMRLKQFWFYPFWVFVFTLVTGLYPAWHAARMAPAKAMRKGF